MGIGWKEYDSAVDTAIDELETEDKLLSQVLQTHREAFNPDANAGSATEKFMAELLVNAPELNLYELMTGETFVDWDDNFSNFNGTFTAEELVALLIEAELLEERARTVEDNFLESAARYRQVTDVYFGGELWEEQQLNNELGRNFRLREEFASAQANRTLPALQEHDEQAFGRVLNATPPGQQGRVSNILVDEVVKQIDIFKEDPEATGVNTGTQFRERLSLLKSVASRPASERGGLGPAPETPEKEPEPARRLPSSLPPSDRLDTMGARPTLSSKTSSIEQLQESFEQFFEEVRIYDEERERRTRLEEEQTRSQQESADRQVREERGDRLMRSGEEPERRRPVSQLPPSERLGTMGARPTLSSETSSIEQLRESFQQFFEEARTYDEERERRTRLEEEVVERNRLGQGNAKESFEQGMAALRQPPPRDVASRPASERGGLGPDRAAESVASRPASERGGLGPAPREDLSGIPAASDPALRGRSTVSAETDDDDEVVETPIVTNGGTPQLTAAQIRDANQAEVEALLASQFGGFSFFLQKHRSELQVGLTADGQVVAADDPNAMTVKNVLDVIVDQGITAPTRVRGLLEQTDWFKNTDARMREYDVLTADMSEPQKTEYLEPVLDLLREEAQFLGFQLDPTRARDLAEKITREGEETDSEVIRGMLVAESAFNAAEVSASSFAAARDEIVAMSKRYFTPIDETIAAEYAQNIYVGTQTAEGVEQMFKEQAAINYPQLQNALNANVTPEQYFAPYKYEIERMLDRPNVDLYEEFGDVIQYIPDTGTDEARPMTLGEVRKYVRGLDEWQQSSQGTDSARALAFSIGRTFGEVA